VCKTEGEGPGETYHVIHSTSFICHHTSQQPHHVQDRPCICASYEDGTESYTKHMKHTQARSHHSKGLLHCLLCHGHPSRFEPCICFIGRTYFSLELVLVLYLLYTCYKNVKKPLHLELMMSVIYHRSCGEIPKAFFYFCILKNWICRRPGNDASHMTDNCSH